MDDGQMKQLNLRGVLMTSRLETEMNAAQMTILTL